MRSADERFSITGEGFQWEQTSGRLLISNQVWTVLEYPPPTRTLPAATAAPNEAARRRREIKASQFEFNSKPRQADYRGHVTVSDADWRLDCQFLSVPIPEPGGKMERIQAEGAVEIAILKPGMEATARADQAVYSLTAIGEEIVLTGNPSWQARTFAGRGQSLSIRSYDERFELKARGKAQLTMTGLKPLAATRADKASAPKKETEAANAEPVEINADEHDLAPELAIFRGRVQVASARRKLACQVMTAHFSELGDRLEKLIAEKEVVIDFSVANQMIHAIAGQARYVPGELTDLLELKGDTRWKSGEYAGRSETLNLRATRQEVEVHATGHAAMTLPRSLFGSLHFIEAKDTPSDSATSPAEPTGWLEVQCRDYLIRSNEAVFQDEVVVSDLPGKLSCDKMTASFSGSGKKIQRLTAERNVLFEQGEFRMTSGRLLAYPASATGLLDTMEADENVEIQIRRGDQVTQASGREAIYQRSGGQFELKGDPVLRLPRNLMVAGAKVLLWQVRNNKFSAKGPYRLTGPKEAIRGASGKLHGPPAF